MTATTPAEKSIGRNLAIRAVVVGPAEPMTRPAGAGDGPTAYMTRPPSETGSGSPRSIAAARCGAGVAQRQNRACQFHGFARGRRGQLLEIHAGTWRGYGRGGRR